MEIFKYKNYDDYVDAQTEANIKKIKNYWVNESTIKSIHKRKPDASVILCHGTRNAKEQKHFKKLYSNANILGTEISKTASQFEMTIQHDFQEELISHFKMCDIVYSNSFDHSINPEKTLEVWLNQLNSTGTLYIEVPLGIDNMSNRWDPLSIDISEIQEIIEKYGFTIIEKFDTIAGMKSDSRTKTIAIALKK